MTPQKDFEVKNQNTLVVQKAERFVVAPRAEPYIYKIAAKRKKGLSRGRSDGERSVPVMAVFQLLPPAAFTPRDQSRGTSTAGLHG